MQKDVRLTVSIEVAGACYAPIITGISNKASADDLRVVHVPNVDLSACSMQKDVRLAVSIEIRFKMTRDRDVIAERNDLIRKLNILGIRQGIQSSRGAGNGDRPIWEPR